MDYGRRIREIRLAQGKTLLDVAIDADMNNGNLSKIERGIEQASKIIESALDADIILRILQSVL